MIHWSIWHHNGKCFFTLKIISPFRFFQIYLFNESANVDKVVRKIRCWADDMFKDLTNAMTAMLLLVWSLVYHTQQFFVCFFLTWDIVIMPCIAQLSILNLNRKGKTCSANNKQLLLSARNEDKRIVNEAKSLYSLQYQKPYSY